MSLPKYFLSSFEKKNHCGRPYLETNVREDLLMSEEVWPSPGEREEANVDIPKMALYSADTSEARSVLISSSP